MARLKDGSTAGGSEILTEGNLESLLGYLPLDPQDLTWDKVTGKPSTFTPSTHTHTIASVTELQNALDEKAGKEVATTQASGLMSSSDKVKLNEIASGANNYTHPASHPISMISGLQAELDSKVESYGTNSVMQIAVISAGGSTADIPNNTLILELE